MKSLEKQLALTLGVFVAAIHAAWVIVVGMGVAQKFLGWIFPLHFLTNVYSVLPFSFGTALFLIAKGFVGGYVLGWVLGWLWNWAERFS